MVTAGLTPDPGTYTIQPGGTVNAGDVALTCPAEGPACEVTVAEDGTFTPPAPGSAPGMVTAMDSASAAARARAEANRLKGIAEAATVEANRLKGIAEADTVEAAPLEGYG